ncbi:hypothetical protein BH20VER3_BH20VER3_19000 [soil metagenome]
MCDSCYFVIGILLAIATLARATFTLSRTT